MVTSLVLEQATSSLAGLPPLSLRLLRVGKVAKKPSLPYIRKKWNPSKQAFSPKTMIPRGRGLKNRPMFHRANFNITNPLE